MSDFRHDFPEDLVVLAERLHEERPQATALELDHIKQRARARATSRSTTRSGPMRSRMAVMMMMVLGMLFSTTGAGLAVSGFSSEGSASRAQYEQPGANNQEQPGEEQQSRNNEKQEDTDDTGTLGEQFSGDDEDEAGDQGAAPNTTSGGNNQSGPQVTRQLGADTSGSLPFTGFAAIPLMLVGLGLLTAGVAIRRTDRNTR